MKDLYSLSSGKKVMIPVTQDPAPVTEDFAKQQQEILSR